MLLLCDRTEMRNLKLWTKRTIRVHLHHINLLLPIGSRFVIQDLGAQDEHPSILEGGLLKACRSGRSTGYPQHQNKSPRPTSPPRCTDPSILPCCPIWCPWTPSGRTHQYHRGRRYRSRCPLCRCWLCTPVGSTRCLRRWP